MFINIGIMIIKEKSIALQTVKPELDFFHIFYDLGNIPLPV